MTTKLIGIKKFRQNMTSLWKEARKKKIKYIVLHHSVPILEINPIEDEEELYGAKLAKEIAEAREQVKRGEVYTEEQVRKELGLKRIIK